MSNDKILIILNGLKTAIPEKSSILSVIRDVQEGDTHLIVEHNGRFIYPQNYGKTRLTEGDSLELIHPDFGG